MTGMDSPAALDNAALDNVVWHSLIGPRSGLAERRGRAARFDPGVSVFAAVDDDATPEAWGDLSDLLGPGGVAVLGRRTLRIPDGWTTQLEVPGVQMVAGPALDVTVAGEVVPQALGPDDVDDMMALIAATDPGPFERRTVEIGGYVGVRAGGKLVAMAGERFRCPGYTEISAVCTDADHRGRGLGSLLTRAVAAQIRARGDEAFLHAHAGNTNAIRLYEALGFTLRTTCDFAAVRRVSDGTRPADDPPAPHGR
ncbi:MAG TPA: GNAT family N-acetyltransferase [Acidimicrobiales bacterium]